MIFVYIDQSRHSLLTLKDSVGVGESYLNRGQRSLERNHHFIIADILDLVKLILQTESGNLGALLQKMDGSKQESKCTDNQSSGVPEGSSGLCLKK